VTFYSCPGNEPDATFLAGYKTLDDRLTGSLAYYFSPNLIKTSSNTILSGNILFTRQILKVRYIHIPELFNPTVF